MEISEALRTIESLADGVDPVTGEIFAHDSPYQSPQILRALFVAIRALEQRKVRQTREKSLPENASKPWEESEGERLYNSFDAGTTLMELARQHNRTEGAIESRLVRLGKLPLSSQAPRRG